MALLKRLSWFSVLLILLGSVALLLSAFALPVGQWIDSGAPARFRIPMAAAGLLLILVGFLKGRIVPFYKDAVLLVANTVLLVLALEFGAAIVLGIQTRIASASANQSMSDTAAGSEQPATAQTPVRAAQHALVRHERFVSWLGEPQQNDSLTIDENGLRVTPFAPTDSTVTPVRLFAFGGSTMWGEGTLDNETIASYLHQELSRHIDYPVQVTNFGQRGWVSTQSLAMLILQLQQGNVPDIVVFYDGYNDTYAPNSGARPGYPEDFDNLQARNAGGMASVARYVQKTNLGRLLVSATGFRPVQPELDVPELSREVVNAYLGVYRMVGALAKEYEFSRRFYWQPQLLIEGKPMTAFEQQIFKEHPWNNQTVRNLTLATYDLMAQEVITRDDLVDISDAFNGVSEPVYFDPCHVLPLGNLQVARTMVSAGLADAVRLKIESVKRRSTK